MATKGAAVSVLAPNGHRQTVKVTAGTPLLQVLEEVCKKQNFNPKEYNLKFQRTVLDLSLQWRFANLPNNAKLEMVSSAQQRSGAENTKVRVALQLEEGVRLLDEFLCCQSLWEVLTHFPQTRNLAEKKDEVAARHCGFLFTICAKVCLEEIAPGSIAVCIYMRDEVSGEQCLKQTTLQSLGLTSGSAIIRFVVRKNMPSGNRQPEMFQEETKKNTYAHKTVRESPPVTKKAAEELTAADQKELQPSDTTNLDPSAVVVEAVDAGLSSAQSINQRYVMVGRPDLECDEPGPSSVGSCKSFAHPQVTSFMPFQGGGQRLGGANVPTEANMPTATTQEPFQSPGPSKAKKYKTNEEESDLGPLDRQSLVCHLDLGESMSASYMELPDNFFEVTMDDVRRRFAELRGERKRLEEAPLLTKALREAQQKEKLERYPKVVLRILFPDRYVLQGFFRVSETIGAVREFVTNHLEEPEIPFYLFITPPRTELDDSLTLFQAQLFPAAVVHFGSPKQKEQFLQQNFVNEAISLSQADIIIARAMPRIPAASAAPVMEENLENGSQATHRAPENYEELSGIPDSHQQVQRDHGKVPKWLKLPGKN
ncbi:tether containing UBX domain for GLUT4 isoform X2 [Dendrobates tinctorius]|uniref:tether containing UBX domain for GLUT4 isoform X2 n=1 Tax=Dendrobates tinctorius TaxID=92724 RepID=UPI003CC994A6